VSTSQGDWRVEAGNYCSRWPPGDEWTCYAVEIDGRAACASSTLGQYQRGAFRDGGGVITLADLEGRWTLERRDRRPARGADRAV
jgi:hypothetical protein